MIRLSLIALLFVWTANAFPPNRAPLKVQAAAAGAAPCSGTIAFVAAGAAASGTTAPAPAYPAGLTSGDLLVLVVANKYPNNGPSTPTDWTLASNAQGSGGSGAAGADSGNVYCTVFYKESDGTETGTLTLTITSANSSIARMFAFSKSDCDWNIAAANGADTSAGTDWSVTAGGDPGVTTADMVLAASAINFANGSSIWSSEAIAQTGVTFGAMTERQDSGTGTADNVHLVVSEHPVDSGTGSAAPVFTMTASTSGANGPAGATVFFRMRLQ